MIARIAGRLLVKELDRVEVMTAGGVGYELAIPLPVFETLPALGEPVELHVHVVVREDAWELYGFATAQEREVFRRVLQAKGVGPALALGLVSALTADGLVRAIRDKDVGTLRGVPRVGAKKAQQLVLDLADKLDDLARGAAPRPLGGGAASDDALRALVSLGYTQAEAERAVRAALEDGAAGGPADLIRAALARIAGK